MNIDEALTLINRYTADIREIEAASVVAECVASQSEEIKKLKRDVFDRECKIDAWALEVQETHALYTNTMRARDAKRHGGDIAGFNAWHSWKRETK